MSEAFDQRYRYYIDASEFLSRATKLLGSFDDSDDCTALLSAAIQLRFGIEARLYEYIDASLRQLNLPAETVDHYAATFLLNRLTELNPDAQDQRSVIIRSQSGKPFRFAFKYTPVTKELAGIHGRLGDAHRE